MIQNKYSSKNVVSVAVAFDDQSSRVAKVGYALAKKLGKGLRLVHVCEPWISNNYSYPMGYHSTLGDVAMAVETSAIEIAQSRMNEIIQTLGKDVAIEQNVLTSGNVSEALAADALVSNTFVTLLAFKGKANWLTPSGWSTALAMMHATDTPIMVLPEDANIDFAAEKVDMMLADDLLPSSDSAVSFGFEFASQYKGANLEHIHICGVTSENLDAAMQTAIAASHTSVSPEVNAGSILKDIDNRLKQNMLSRSDSYLQKLQQRGSSYKQVIRNGEVREELNRYVEQNKPQIMIFGRHQAFHRAPFFLGRIPFHSMLNQGHAVVMVPND